MAGSDSASPTSSPSLRWPRVFWPVLLATIIWIGSSRATVDTGPEIPFTDKAAHFLIYGLLATLILRVFFSGPRAARHVLLAVVLAALYGAADELHQSLVPERSMEFVDWIADTSGALLAAALYGWWRPWRGWLERSAVRPFAKRIARVSPTADVPAALR